jgi:hypothetical protein
MSAGWAIVALAIATSRPPPGQPPAQHPPAEPVDDGDEADEAARRRDAGDVGGPDLVGPRHRQLAQQIGIDLVARRRLRDVRSPVDRLDRHLLHQRRNLQAADLDAFGDKPIPQHSAAREREVQVQLVELPHDSKVIFASSAAADSKRCRG